MFVIWKSLVKLGQMNNENENKVSGVRVTALWGCGLWEPVRFNFLSIIVQTYTVVTKRGHMVQQQPAEAQYQLNVRAFVGLPCKKSFKFQSADFHTHANLQHILYLHQSGVRLLAKVDIYYWTCLCSLH